MKSFNVTTAAPKKLISGIVVLVICVFVIVYAWVQVSSNVSSDIETVPAVMVETNIEIDSQAFIFRDETIIPINSNGTVVTIVSDSQRVSRGQKIANVFSTDDAVSLQDEINRLQRKMDVFDKSVVETEYFVTDIDSVNNDIDSTLDDIYESVSDGSLSSSINLSEELLIKLNKRNLIVNSQQGYSFEYETLSKEKTALENRLNSVSHAVYAPSSGYYYGDVDGYENIFKITDIESLTLSEMDRIADASADSELINSSAGKIVNDFVWYTVCKVNSEKLTGISEGTYYKVLFPNAQDKTITMLAERIVKETSSADALIILRANTVPTDFNFLRTQSAKILIGDASGLAIPTHALRVIDGVKGVYVLVGDVVRFRRVEIIDERDDYYIISTDSEDYSVGEDTPETSPLMSSRLSLYDNVITSGKNLFDGKIVG